MQEGDLVKIDLLVKHSGSSKSKEAWSRIKKDFEELAQQTNNSAMVPCNRWSKNVKWQYCLLERTCGSAPCMVARH